MSTALKNTALSQEDKTDEFILPPLKKELVKNIAAAPVAVSTPVVQKVQVLKSATKQINEDIEVAKSEAVRQVDESTRVFNLRQAQLMQKIKDLEVRKVHAEKEIRKIIDQKNSTLHEDLTKTSQHIEREFETGMGKISNLRNELQNLIEQLTIDRKKNYEALSSQGTEIENLHRTLQSCQDFMQREYIVLSTQLRPLMQEKVDIEKTFLNAKADFSRLETESKLVESRKFSAELEVLELTKKLESQVMVEKEQRSLIESLADQIENYKQEINRYHSEVRELNHKKEVLEAQIIQTQEGHDAIQKNGEHLKWSLITLTEQHDQKKASLTRQDAEMIELKHRLEEHRTKENDLIKSCSNYQSTLTHLQSEVSAMESSKASAFKLQEDALHFLNERKDFYNKHVQDLEYTHKVKMGELEHEHENEKLRWDLSFKAFEEEKKFELEAKLEEQTVKYHAILKEKQSELMDDMVKVIKRHLTRTVFESGQQRAELAQEELEPILRNYFNQTTALQIKPWKQWKPWMWSTVVCATTVLGLIIKIKFF
jgi:chromosome segregation ATPase